MSKGSELLKSVIDRQIANGAETIVEVPVRRPYGINVDYTGEATGLWFDPSMVTVDDNCYVSLTWDELSDLRNRINNELGQHKVSS